MSSTSTTSTPVKRACDSCHRRKVKCIGEGTKACKNCVSAGLNCTYNAIPQKKGPKGSRAKVLSELRENQRQSQLAPGYPDPSYGGRSMSPTLSRAPGLLSPELINHCVDLFFSNLYPSQPILHRRKVQDAIMSMDHSIEAYCLITALCAYMLIQPNLSFPQGVRIPQQYQQYGEAGQSNVSYGQVLLEESVRVRKGYSYVDSPTTVSITTSFFLYGSYFCLDKQNSAWFYLREATTFAHILGLHNEETYKLVSDTLERAMMRRLFWLLFVTERAYAIHKHRPLSLHATIELPSLDDTSPQERIHINGFTYLINLYKPFDNTFIELWNKIRTSCMPSWLSELQQQLSEALPTYLQSTEVQTVDLRTSQQWLRTIVWQLSVSHGFISSMATEKAMSFKYPIEISRDLIAMSNQVSQQAMEVHGEGLIEKLFDVACTLTDVMACVPLNQQDHEQSPYSPYMNHNADHQTAREYLQHFLTLISSLRGGQSRYLPLLLQKTNEVLPNMAVPLTRSLQTPPQRPSSASSTPHVASSQHIALGNPRIEELYTQGNVSGIAVHHSGPNSLSGSSSAPTSHETTPAPPSVGGTPTVGGYESPPSHGLPMHPPSHSSLGYGDVSVTPPVAAGTPYQNYAVTAAPAHIPQQQPAYAQVPGSNLMSNIAVYGGEVGTAQPQPVYASHPGMEMGIEHGTVQSHPHPHHPGHQEPYGS